jgi:hypothetical protein
LTYELSAGAELSAGVSVYVFGVSETAGLEGGYTLSIDLSPEGEVTEVSLTTRVEVAGGTTAGVTASGLGARAGLDVSFTDGGYLETTFALPVGDSPQAQATVHAFLDDPLGNVGDFLGVVDDHGTVLVQGYEFSERTDEAGIALEILAAFGTRDSDTYRSFDLVGAASYDPANGLMVRDDCLR